MTLGPRYMGMGWWLSIINDVEKWDTITAYEEPFLQPLPTDPEERQKRLKVLGFVEPEK